MSKSTFTRVIHTHSSGKPAHLRVGDYGQMWYDPVTGALRVSDGETPGGKVVSSSAGQASAYRGYQAGANFFRNTNDQDIAQIFIHDGQGPVDYINFTKDSDNDDFYVTGLQHDGYAGNTGDDWNASKVIALNVYGNPGTLSVADITNFVKKFIDVVLYNDNDNERNIEEAKTAFYDNIALLKQALPAGSLFENFEFDDYNRLHYPEYGNTAENYSAGFKVYIDQSETNPLDADYSYNNIASIAFLSAGQNYNIGDTLTVNGAQLGGVDGANDLTLTVLALQDGNILELTMTNGGDGFYPAADWNDTWSLNFGDGGNAQIRINACDQSGAIVDFEVRNGGGFGYSVGNVLTINNGGTDATFEVTAVGTAGIADWELSGTAYVGSPGRVQNGYWPRMNIGDGGDDQYDGGNWISTDRSSASLLVDILGNKMTINNYYKEVSPQAGQWITIRVPDSDEYQYARIVAQSTDNTNVWFLDGSFEYYGVQARTDGIPYYGSVVESNEFGGLAVTVYDQSIFAMMAFGINNVNSVYYNGETGADGSGYKDIQVILGSADGSFENKAIPQNNQNGSNEYRLREEDAGKHIYGVQNVIVPTASELNFPIGTVITVVSNDNWCYIYPNDSNVTQIWGAGFNDTSNNFYIPQHSIATLLKVGQDKWMLSGAGLGID